MTHDGTSVEWGSVDGNPSEAANYYVAQTQPEDCVEMSSADLIEQVTGHDVSEQQITSQAASMTSDHDTDANGNPSQLYIASQGTDFRDAPELLASYGVQSTYSDDTTGSGNNVDSLAQTLASGQHVMVAVDAEKIWDAIGVENAADPGHADHAVVVTGVDLANGVVYINDSGNSDTNADGSPAGADEAVPISVFEQAWGTSGHAMVTVDPSQTQTTTDVTPNEPPAPDWGYSVNPTVDPTQQTPEQTPEQYSTISQEWAALEPELANAEAEASYELSSIEAEFEAEIAAENEQY
jgi:uncharacterized protein YvpB